VKKPWRRSNRYNALGQMLQTNQRLDKLAAMRASFVERGMLPATHIPPRSTSEVHTPNPQILNDEDNNNNNNGDGDDDDDGEGPLEGEAILGHVVLAQKSGKLRPLSEYYLLSEPG